jgi:hypothetical protein
MSRHIDESDLFGEKCKAQVNGHTPFLFFHKTIGISAGQSFDQRGFTVIDMSGGADDDV